jgi:hypothetical protein
MADAAANEHGEGAEAARVLRTGIALVHEGELVLPAAGSEAQAERAAADARAVIHYYFPVEIEVRAAGGGDDIEAAAREALLRLARGLRSV